MAACTDASDKNCNAKLQLSPVFTTGPPSVCGKKQLFIRGLLHMNTTKRIKRRAVLASGSVSLSGSVSVSTTLHQLPSMSRDVTRDGEKTLFSVALEKHCPLDKYE